MGSGLRRIDPDTRAVRVTSYRYGDTRIEYTAGVETYLGAHLTQGAATTDSEWYITKFTYDGNDLVRIEGPLDGAWDDRATLAWGA